MTGGSVVVAGAVARRIRAGGHVWALLSWALGFRSLGWEVLFLDRLEDGGHVSVRRIRAFEAVLRRMGLDGAYSLDLGPGRPTVGVDRDEVLRRTGAADLLLNVMGYLDDEEILAAAPVRVFLDIDPGFGQMWHALGQCDLFAGHDRFVTVGTAVGSDGCRVPTCGLPWIPTPPPVLVEAWTSRADGSSPHRAPSGARTAYTSVGAWRGPWDAVEYEGERFGLRAHAFRPLATLPGKVEPLLEIALDVDPADGKDVRALREGGWSVVDPAEVASDPDAYRRYITRSRGELGVAKEMYVRSRSGWFSDRTACYLAAGRPAIVHDTGVVGLPTGLGLLTFQSPDEAAAAIDAVESSPATHARAARDLAAAHLDARIVLSTLVDALAETPATRKAS